MNNLTPPILTHTLSLLLLLFSLIIFVSSSQDELRSLLEFKKGIRVDPLGKVLNSWNQSSAAADPNSCPHSFYGVVCADSGNVTAILLDGLGLAGDLKFFTLNGLKMLRNLSLSGNFFTGRLVPALGFMYTLQYLDLSGNLFYGPIPARMNDLWGLNYLNLSSNNFTGVFPTGIRNLQQLYVLDLHSNQLRGDIQDLFSELRNVEFVDLSYNMFYGSLSMDLYNISSLANTVQHLNLSNNDLGGGFFKDEAIQLFRNLEVLDLGHNHINGQLPSFGSLPNLQVLRLGNNRLFGLIPEELLEDLIRLKELDLSGNGFSGPIHVINSTTLSILNLSSNVLSGSLPSSVGGCRIVDLSRNVLTGDISVMQSWEATLDILDVSTLPSDIGNLGRLKFLNLAKNGLLGPIPNELSKLGGLEYLDLSSNNFNSNIPDNLPSSLKVFNVSHNNLSGPVPENLRNFPNTSFYPGNSFLFFPNGKPPMQGDDQGRGKHHRSKSSIRVGIIFASVGAAVMIAFVLYAYHRAQLQDFRIRSGFSGQTTERDVKLGRLSRPSLFKFHPNVEPPPTSLSFSNDHLLTSNSRTLSGPTELGTEIVEHVLPEGGAAPSTSLNPIVPDTHPTAPQLSSSPRFIDAIEQPVTLDVNSPDRLAGELFFLDVSLAFTAEELSRAPAEILGRSSHGTLYKATLDSGHMLTVKWMRVGLVKHKKEFAKEVKKIGSMRHPNIIPLRAYYWGPREQERLILADYVRGDNLALHLYETTPRRYSPLSFSQRLKVAIDIARCLTYLHDSGLPHGNLKPTNVLLEGSDLNAHLTDYSLHRLMTPAGIAEQLLNLGALGYRAPELATAAKPVPSFKADVYAFGVILMELLTRRSAGDIISGQSGAVDLTDWVRLCDHEGRGMDCIDRDIASGEEHSRAMDELLAISLRCILPVNERPNIRLVFDNLCSISV
ncbi:hypothetical protein HYC85_001833 [Camellia sinensis]|uniref:Protein kinase domain-containing protein n=1 Tax=Camellia sinensis TaxID=4442 RepID=A0A7J7I8B1_CAMSI|nr:hypothetical protein HYC85_001833 [Camellia sinensis]